MCSVILLLLVPRPAAATTTAAAAATAGPQSAAAATARLPAQQSVPLPADAQPGLHQLHLAQIQVIVVRLVVFFVLLLLGAAVLLTALLVLVELVVVALVRVHGATRGRPADAGRGGERAGTPRPRLSLRLRLMSGRRPGSGPAGRGSSPGAAAGGWWRQGGRGGGREGARGPLAARLSQSWLRSGLREKTVPSATSTAAAIATEPTKGRASPRRAAPSRHSFLRHCAPPRRPCVEREETPRSGLPGPWTGAELRGNCLPDGILLSLPRPECTGAISAHHNLCLLGSSNSSASASQVARITDFIELARCGGSCL
ncbi:uncharacterized protein LOC128928932 [Callithrix jacchus]